MDGLDEAEDVSYAKRVHKRNDGNGRNNYNYEDASENRNYNADYEAEDEIADEIHDEMVTYDDEAAKGENRNEDPVTYFYVHLSGSQAHETMAQDATLLQPTITTTHVWLLVVIASYEIDMKNGEDEADSHRTKDDDGRTHENQAYDTYVAPDSVDDVQKDAFHANATYDIDESENNDIARTYYRNQTCDVYDDSIIYGYT